MKLQAKEQPLMFELSCKFLGESGIVLEDSVVTLDIEGQFQTWLRNSTGETKQLMPEPHLNDILHLSLLLPMIQ